MSGIRHLTVLVDTRERRPLLFPKLVPVWLTPDKMIAYTVDTRRERLDVADYAIEGYEDLTGVERKAGLKEELVGNFLTRDRIRTIRALSRFARRVKHPYLFIQRTPKKFWDADGSTEGRRLQKAMDLCLHEAAKYSISIVWGGRDSPKESALRRLGEMILRLMLAHVLLEESNHGTRTCKPRKRKHLRDGTDCQVDAADASQ